MKTAAAVGDYGRHKIIRPLIPYKTANSVRAAVIGLGENALLPFIGVEKKILEELSAMSDFFSTLRSAWTNPTDPASGSNGSRRVWVSPDLKAEGAYRGLTGSGELRAASFKGLIEG